MSVPEHGYAPQWRVSCSSFSDLGLPLALVHPAVRVYVLAVTATGHFTHNWLLLYSNCGVQVLMSPLPWVNNFQNNLDMHVDIRALKKKFATWIRHTGSPVERIIWRVKVKGKGQAGLGALLAVALVLAADSRVSASGRWNWSVEGLESAMQPESGLSESSAAQETWSQYSDTECHCRVCPGVPECVWVCLGVWKHITFDIRRIKINKNMKRKPCK